MNSYLKREAKKRKEATSKKLPVSLERDKNTSTEFEETIGVKNNVCESSTKIKKVRISKKFLKEVDVENSPQRLDRKWNTERVKGLEMVQLATEKWKKEIEKQVDTHKKKSKHRSKEKKKSEVKDESKLLEVRTTKEEWIDQPLLTATVTKVSHNSQNEKAKICQEKRKRHHRRKKETKQDNSNEERMLHFAMSPSATDSKTDAQHCAINQISCLESETKKVDNLLSHISQYKKIIEQVRHEKSQLIVSYENTIQKFRSHMTNLEQENHLLLGQIKKGESQPTFLKSDEAEATKILLEHLHKLQVENSGLVIENEKQRLQYEKCLDDIANQVVHTLLSQRSLREECSKLKQRVHELETQNNNLSHIFRHHFGGTTGYLAQTLRCKKLDEIHYAGSLISVETQTVRSSSHKEDATAQNSASGTAGIEASKNPACGSLTHSELNLSNFVHDVLHGGSIDSLHSICSHFNDHLHSDEHLGRAEMSSPTICLQDRSLFSSNSSIYQMCSMTNNNAPSSVFSSKHTTSIHSNEALLCASQSDKSSHSHQACMRQSNKSRHLGKQILRNDGDVKNYSNFGNSTVSNEKNSTSLSPQKNSKHFTHNIEALPINNSMKIETEFPANDESPRVSQVIRKCHNNLRKDGRICSFFENPPTSHCESISTRCVLDKSSKPTLQSSLPQDIVQALMGINQNLQDLSPGSELLKLTDSFHEQYSFNSKNNTKVKKTKNLDSKYELCSNTQEPTNRRSNASTISLNEILENELDEMDTPLEEDFNAHTFALVTPDSSEMNKSNNFHGRNLHVECLNNARSPRCIHSSEPNIEHREYNDFPGASPLVKRLNSDLENKKTLNRVSSSLETIMNNNNNNSTNLRKPLQRPNTLNLLHKNTDSGPGSLSNILIDSDSTSSSSVRNITTPTPTNDETYLINSPRSKCAQQLKELPLDKVMELFEKPSMPTRNVGIAQSNEYPDDFNLALLQSVNVKVHPTCIRNGAHYDKFHHFMSSSGSSASPDSAMQHSFSSSSSDPILGEKAASRDDGYVSNSTASASCSDLNKITDRSHSTPYSSEYGDHPEQSKLNNIAEKDPNEWNEDTSKEVIQICSEDQRDYMDNCNNSVEVKFKPIDSATRKKTHPTFYQFDCSGSIRNGDITSKDKCACDALTCEYFESIDNLSTVFSNSIPPSLPPRDYKIERSNKHFDEDGALINEVCSSHVVHHENLPIAHVYEVTSASSSLLSVSQCIDSSQSVSESTLTENTAIKAEGSTEEIDLNRIPDSAAVINQLNGNRKARTLDGNSSIHLVKKATPDKSSPSPETGKVSKFKSIKDSLLQDWRKLQQKLVIQRKGNKHKFSKNLLKSDDKPINLLTKRSKQNIGSVSPLQMSSSAECTSKVFKEKSDKEAVDDSFQKNVHTEKNWLVWSDSSDDDSEQKSCEDYSKALPEWQLLTPINDSNLFSSTSGHFEPSPLSPNDWLSFPHRSMDNFSSPTQSPIKCLAHNEKPSSISPTAVSAPLKNKHLLKVHSSDNNVLLKKPPMESINGVHSSHLLNNSNHLSINQTLGCDIESYKINEGINKSSNTLLKNEDEIKQYINGGEILSQRMELQENIRVGGEGRENSDEFSDTLPKETISMRKKSPVQKPSSLSVHEHLQQDLCKSKKQLFLSDGEQKHFASKVASKKDFRLAPCSDTVLVDYGFVDSAFDVRTCRKDLKKDLAVEINAKLKDPFCDVTHIVYKDGTTKDIKSSTLHHKTVLNPKKEIFNQCQNRLSTASFDSQVSSNTGVISMSDSCYEDYISDYYLS